MPPFDPAAVEALLFDLGGVVVEIDFERCVSSWATSAGRPVDEVRAAFRFDAPYEAHERGEIDAAAYFDSLRRSLGVDLDDDELLAGWTSIYVGVIDGIVPLLSAASAVLPIAAFTNSNPSHIAACNERFGEQLASFRRVFASSELGRRKPERAAFHAVAAEMGVAPSGILFFDDGEANVAGALDAGLQAVRVTSPTTVRDALAVLGIEASP